MHKHNLSTSNFNSIFKFGIKIFILLIILFIFFYNVSCQYQDNYNASLLDKVERLNSIEEPKIVLLGNSNLAFGIDSQMIEEELNMPVVNMGLHGSLGNAFHEEMAKFNVTEGDIYVLCHTDYDTPNYIELPELAWITLENHFELYQILRFQDLWPMIKSYPIYLKKCLNILTNGEQIDPYLDAVYYRQAFNQYGDIGIERTKNRWEFNNEIAVPSINTDTAERINHLSAWLNDRGASLVVAGYPITNGDMTPDKTEYENFQLELENALECDVISDFTEYMFDYKYFYDTDLHLTTEGAKLRTAQLITDLKNWETFN